MVRSTVLRYGSSLLACAVFGFSGAAHANQESLFQTAISGEVAEKFLKGSRIDRSLQVFVRLDELSISELNIASIEAGGEMLDAKAQRAAARRLSAQQARVIDELEALGAETLGTMRVGANGIRVSVPLSEIARISNMPGVRSVSRVDTHIRGNHFNSVPWIGAPAVWEALGDGENVSVGIIDTGIDYYHANFGGSGNVADFDADDTTIIEPGSFPTEKVVGGYDFVGDDYNGNNAPMPDADPLDCNGHGSHVAGSAAGLGVGTSIGPGVAKGADLYALRVFGCDGSTRVTSEAIEWAMDPNGDGDMSDHLDVINMSLGSSNGYPGDPTAIASDNAAKAGIIVVASAGNSSDAPYITGSPGVAARAISVSAFVSGGMVPAVQISGAFDGLAEAVEGSSPVLVADGTVSAELAIPSAAANGVRNGCAPFPEDMTGKIALISRGSCAFADKSANAEAQGAIALVVYNDGADPGRVAPIAMGGLEGASIPAVMIPSFVGQQVTEEIAAGASAEAVLDASLMTATLFEDVIAGFSSRGPGSGGSGFKPDLGSSGVNITSAGVGTGDGTLTISGTSMSAPHVAGAAALLYQKRGKLPPEIIKAILQNSTRDSNPLNAAAGPFPLSRSGVGVADVYKAVNLDAVAFPGGASFGRIDRNRDTRLRERVRVQSLEGGARTFDVTHVPNQTVPGVTIDCGGPVTVTGSGRSRSALTNIVLSTDVSAMPIDFGNFSHQEVDGHCVFSDGEDMLRVGYMAAIDAGSRMYARTTGRGNLRIVNSGEAAGFVHLFTKTGGQGQFVNGTSNAIAGTGFRSTDPADFFGFPVMEIAVATEQPWDALMSHEFDIEIDENFDGIPEAVLVVADQGLFSAQPSLSGTMVTAQFDLVNGGGFLDWFVTGADFNDRVGYFPFTKTGGGGLVPERFAYNLISFGPEGAADLQSGVIDTAAEVAPEIGSFGLIPNSQATLESENPGEVMALFSNNAARLQVGTATVQ